MPSLTVPDDVFERLAKRAAALNVTVEQLVAPLLDLAAAGGESPAAPAPASFGDWKTNFEAWMADVQARSRRYPPGFIMDDSRQSMYEGCGE